MAMNALWLLVRHADAEPRLQQALLDHYGALPQFGGMQGKHYAMLVDRVLRAQDKPQLYGSPMPTPCPRWHRWRIRNDWTHCAPKSA